MHKKERGVMKKAKAIPSFSSETQEQEFWEKMIQVNLSTKTIYLRLSEALLNIIKIEANKREVPFQSFIKT